MKITLFSCRPQTCLLPLLMPFRLVFKYLSQTIIHVALFSLLSGCVTEVNDPLEAQRDDVRFVNVSNQAALEYLRIGKTDDALRHLNNALEKDDKSAGTHNALGLLYRMTGDRELEEKHYKLAIRYDSQSSKFRNNYATFLFSNQRYEEALEHLDFAAKDTTYPNRGLAFLNKGRCYIQLNRIDEAEDAFIRAIRVNNALARAHLELANIYFDQIDLKRARFYLKQYSDLTRHTARSLWLGIRIERELGDLDALASYELALRNLYPNSKEYEAFETSKTQ